MATKKFQEAVEKEVRRREAKQMLLEVKRGERRKKFLRMHPKPIPDLNKRIEELMGFMAKTSSYIT